MCVFFFLLGNFPYIVVGFFPMFIPDMGFIFRSFSMRFSFFVFFFFPFLCFAISSNMLNFVLCFSIYSLHGFCISVVFTNFMS